jgi:hypothetical protein
MKNEHDDSAMQLVKIQGRSQSIKIDKDQRV